MADTLHIGDHAYSSWSLRAWLLFEKFDLAVETRLVPFDGDQSVGEQMAVAPPSRTVPTLVTADGTVIWDSLAIAEEVHARHPEAGIWPADPAARAFARALAAEMHSGFSALRTDCPMALRVAYAGFQPSEAVRGDLARIDTLWRLGLDRFGGPWLVGAYSAADAFFAPVAARIATYDLPVSPEAQAYVGRHLADPAFRAWRRTGLSQGNDLPWYAKDLPTRPWPGPEEEV
ncbi:MAG: glutathione S-transferase [Pseudomonadota bacterium]